ncbi:MAG: hypothetical protein HUJ30_09485 [Gammaproteobacteria bacterium]|nr:hypothetical protein [Gammaproteobacteria bacterium]
MAKQATKSILSSFTLSDSQKQKVVDKPTERRNKLLGKLDEQILAAEAALNGEEYFGTKTVTEVDEDGTRTSTTVPKRVIKWFYTNNGSEWLLELKYGNRVLPLAKDKTAIVVGDLENMVPVLKQVKEAVAANELDNAIEAVLSKK